MTVNLKEINDRLIEAIKLSGQLSLGRRSPKPEAEAIVNDIIFELRSYLKGNPVDDQAWRLLSQAEEILLRYKEAIDYLEKAISLTGKKDKRDLKRLTRMKEQLTEWTELPLSPRQLEELGNYLELHLAATSDARDLRLTKEWLQKQGFPGIDRILESLANRGAYSDSQVLYNVVRG